MSGIETFLHILHTKQGADLHLKVGAPAMVRVGGKLVKITEEILSAGHMEEIAKELLANGRWERFRQEKEADLAVQMSSDGRYRVNIFYQRGNIGIVMRRVKTHIPTIDGLMLPAILKDIALANSGLIIMSGPTGCGKSSTLAAMLDWINSQREAHILTVEDPVEYLHTDKMGIVNQREIGIDTADFTSALRYCMRQDPDVIMIGEMRDQVSLMAGLHAAETGHLVLSTLHTTDAGGIIPRILDLVPHELQDQVRAQVASVFTAGICQRLVPTFQQPSPVAATVEILVGTTLVKKLIRDNKLDKLYAAIETGEEFGMRTFNKSLLEMVNNKIVTKEEALSQSLHPEALKMNLQGIFLDEAKRILSAD